MDVKLNGCKDLEQMSWLAKVRVHLIKKEIIKENDEVNMSDYISYYLSMFPPYAVAKKLVKNK
jgi:hypothetical protein